MRGLINILVPTPKMGFFKLSINKKSRAVYLDGAELNSSRQIVESDVEGTCYKVRFSQNKFFFENSIFGFDKVYYQQDQDWVRLTNDIKALELHEFDRDGVISILVFGYLVPGVSLYKGVSCLAPRSILSYDWVCEKICVEYGRLPQRSSRPTTLDDIKSRLRVSTKDYSFLMSGGRDSFVIGGLNQDENKKTFTFKMDSFQADELDYVNVAGYSYKIKGRNKLICLKASDISLVQSYVRSTTAAFDHVHAGRWKFDYFIKSVTAQIGEGLIFANGQTADTIISLNLTGDDLRSRIRRAAFYGDLDHRIVKKLLQTLSPLLSVLIKKNSGYMKGLAASKCDAEYYSGYFLNDIPFPGFEVNKRLSIARISGSDPAAHIYRKFCEFMGLKIMQYGEGEAHLMMLDVCLSTFIWGMDMRGLREACQRYGHETKFLFMNDDLINAFLSLPYKSISPLAKYKSILSDIESEFGDLHDRKFDRGGVDGSKFCASFEGLVLGGALGAYFGQVLDSEDFARFKKNMLEKHSINLQGLEISASNYTYLDRVVSLYTWQKHYLSGNV